MFAAWLNLIVIQISEYIAIDVRINKNATKINQYKLKNNITV